MKTKLIKVLFFTLLATVNMSLMAQFVEYTAYIDVKYMFENDAESVHTVTTDTVFTVGDPFFLVIDISILVQRNRLPLLAPRNYTASIAFEDPKILSTSVVESVGNLKTDERQTPRLIYSFDVPVHPTIVGTDNKPVSVAPSTVRIRCEPLSAGTQEINIFFSSPSINRGYNRMFVITVNEK